MTCAGRSYPETDSVSNDKTIKNIYIEQIEIRCRSRFIGEWRPKPTSEAECIRQSVTNSYRRYSGRVEIHFPESFWKIDPTVLNQIVLAPSPARLHSPFRFTGTRLVSKGVIAGGVYIDVETCLRRYIDDLGETYDTDDTDLADSQIAPAKLKATALSYLVQLINCSADYRLDRIQFETIKHLRDEAAEDFAEF